MPPRIPENNDESFPVPQVANPSHHIIKWPGCKNLNGLPKKLFLNTSPLGCSNRQWYAVSNRFSLSLASNRRAVPTTCCCSMLALLHSCRCAPGLSRRMAEPYGPPMVTKKKGKSGKDFPF